MDFMQSCIASRQYKKIEEVEEVEEVEEGLREFK
jgi:hypothetical protein